MGIRSIIRNVKADINKLLGRDCIRVDYAAAEQVLSIRCPYSFEDRAIKSLEMFMMAFEYAKPRINKDLHALICFEDYPERILTKRVIFSYTSGEAVGAGRRNNIVMIPDFCFLNWKESGMTDYEDCCHEMLELSKKPPQYDTLFWIGNTKTHPTRKMLCALSEKDPRIEAYGMDWKYSDGRAVPTRFISLQDHTKYKYLIDVQGRGYSGRTKMLMFSGRPLFIADRKWKEFWYQDLVPFKHYIPVKEDLSDLTAQLDWVEANPEEAQRIAENAQAFARERLTRKAALRYLENTIVSCANGRE